MIAEGMDKGESRRRRRCSLHDVELAATGECDECSKLLADGQPVTVTVFDHDEDAYPAWLAAHPRGYVVNIERGLNLDRAKLHCAECYSISDPGKPYVSGDYVKVCADQRAELDEWAGTQITRCGHCF